MGGWVSSHWARLVMIGARPTEVFLRNHIRMLFSAHPSERGTALAEPI